MKPVLLIAIGVGLALLFKASGRLAATLYRTDATSAKWTIAQHFSLAKRLFAAAVVLALIVVAVFLVPPAWALLALAFALALLVFLNCALGGLAGTLGSLGGYLSRPHRWDELQRQIVMNERARTALRRLIVPALLAALFVLSSPTMAGGICAIALDHTASLRERAREEALSFMKATINDYVETMECDSLAVIKFGAETRFAEHVWLQAVREPAAIGCETVEAEPLTGHGALFQWATNVRIARKRDAVTACERERKAARAEDESKLEQFRRDFAAAIEVSPRVEHSRIRNLVGWLVGSGTYHHLVVVSDLLDNPPVSLDGFTIPDGVSVLLIAAEPDSAYGTTSEVLARAADWSRIPNVRVVTTAELHPAFWRQAGRK